MRRLSNLTSLAFLSSDPTTAHAMCLESTTFSPGLSVKGDQTSSPSCEHTVWSTERCQRCRRSRVRWRTSFLGQILSRTRASMGCLLPR